MKRHDLLLRDLETGKLIFGFPVLGTSIKDLILLGLKPKS